MVKVLVELGMDPIKEDSLKQTPLFYASREGNSQVIDFFCNQCGDSVNRQDKYGQTCLYYAVREGHVRSVQQLIDLGAGFDHEDTKN